MAPRVLLSLDDIVLAAAVAPLLHEQGLEGVVLAEPARLSQRGADDALIAVVVQDQYMDGVDGLAQLALLHESRPQPVPAILVSQQVLPEEQRRPLAKNLLVRAFLSSSASPESLVEAIQMAARPSPRTDPAEQNPFESQGVTMQEGADPFDLLVELQDEIVDDAESDPHREVTRTVAIPVPPEARAQAKMDRADTDELAIDPSQLRDPADVPSLPVDALTAIDEGPVELAAEVLTEIHDPPAVSIDETSIDLNIMTLGIEPVDGGPGIASAADDEEQEDMARIAELEAQLTQAQAAREKAESERDRSQRIAKERAEAERKLKERLQKLESSSSESSKAELARLKQLEAESKDLRRYREAADRKIRKLENELREIQGPVPELAGGMFDDDEGAPPAEGRFEQLPYPRLLGRLLKHRFSGVMHVRSGVSTREIYFASGKPNGYSSSSPGEKLGRILVDQKRITEEQYLKATSRMVERGVKLTDALLELGYMDSQGLDEEMRFLTRDQIVRGFGMTEGSFTLEENAPAPDEVTRFEFSPGEIYLAGYRQYTPDGEVKALYETMRRLYLKTTDEMAAYRPHLGLEAEDERLLRLLGSAYTIEEAVEQAEIGEDRAARLLGALRGLGLICAWNPSAKQFEERVRQMHQQQQAALLALREELQQREDRMVDTFEKALGKLEAGGSAVLTASGGDAFHVPLSRNEHEENTEPYIDQSRLQRPPTQPSMEAVKPPPSSADTGPQESDVASALDQAFSPGADTSSAAPEASPSTDSSSDQGSPADGKFREGMNHAAQGKLDEAEIALREAVRLDAQQPSYLAALARVLLSNPKYDRAGTLPVVRSLLDRAQALAPDDDEVRSLLARVSSEQAQLET